MFNKTNLINITSEQGYIKFFCNPIPRINISTPSTNPYRIDCDILGIHDDIDPDVGGEVVYTNIPIGTKFIIERNEGGDTTVGVATGDCDLTWNEQDVYGLGHYEKVITITNSHPLEIEFEGAKKYKKGGVYAIQNLDTHMELQFNRTVAYPDDLIIITVGKDYTYTAPDVGILVGTGTLYFNAVKWETMYSSVPNPTGFGESSYQKGDVLNFAMPQYSVQTKWTDSHDVNAGGGVGGK